MSTIRCVPVSTYCRGAAFAPKFPRLPGTAHPEKRGLMSLVLSRSSRQEYNRNFCRRLSSFRKRAGYKTQADFARELGVLASTYSKYEERSPLPHYLLPDACDLLDCGVYELLTGLSNALGPPRQIANQNRPCHSDCWVLLMRSNIWRCNCPHCNCSQPDQLFSVTHKS